ncbi:MAG: hypothetical protein FJ280_32705, partial [Planctomycetes bacterium]|nr:hypothetical protein [Planctomycetota bacterium]
MKRCTLRFVPEIILLLLLGGASLGSPAVTDVGISTRELVERAWIEQDRQFTDALAAPERCEFSLQHTRQIVARGAGLADRLQKLSPANANLERRTAGLRDLGARLEAAESTDNTSVIQRRRLYLDARWAVREIALSHPLLS